MGFGRSFILSLITVALWVLAAVTVFRTPGSPSELDQVESYVCENTKFC
jgi:hypothetical protein